MLYLFILNCIKIYPLQYNSKNSNYLLWVSSPITSSGILHIKIYMPYFSWPWTILKEKICIVITYWMSELFRAFLHFHFIKYRLKKTRLKVYSVYPPSYISEYLFHRLSFFLHRSWILCMSDFSGHALTLWNFENFSRNIK